jgi:hypothetical protein
LRNTLIGALTDKDFIGSKFLWLVSVVRENGGGSSRKI